MNKWIWKLADNGWVDWICPKCGWRYNDDIHVTLDYKYCPMCGERLIDDGEIVSIDECVIYNEFKTHKTHY